MYVRNVSHTVYLRTDTSNTISVISEGAKTMKVSSYSYRRNNNTHHVYVNDDADTSAFPKEIQEVIKSGSKSMCNESVIDGFGPKGREKFEREGYLSPEITFKEIV